jgi:hypothetical protein
MSDLVERLRERATSYRAGGSSSEHTAVMLDEAADRIAQLEAALREFCDRVDRGEVKSVTTYAKFKALLEDRT